MGGAKSTPKTQTASSVTQVKHTRECGPINMQMIQNVLLIWLDNNIDENSSNCQKTIGRLRCTVNAVNVFTDDAECIQFLDDMAKEKVCMIISGALGQKVVPRVHDLSQIDSMFIFCANKTYHEEWAKNWPKIKGVFTELEPICVALKQVTQQCEQNAVSISIMDAKDTLPKKSLDQLDPSFIYTLIMKEILLTINFEQQHIVEFIEHCRQVLHGNARELELLDQLAKTYHKHTPIWWYTRESFLYPMLNRALRTLDVGLMIKIGFFIADLHRHIQQLHHEEFGGNGPNQKFLVYRGQGMEKADFEKMVASKGGLISFNCFLSTSRAHHVSLGFAKRAISKPQLFGVLFVMAIDPALPDTPFASVGTVGAMGGKEYEILFSMNTVFRIGSIEQQDNHPSLFRVELSMTTEKDDDLRRLIYYIREETFPGTEGWYRLGQVLWKFGEASKAQQVYEILLRQTTEENTRASIYRQLGIMANVLGQYGKAIEYNEESIRIEEKQNPYDHLRLAASYNNIGLVYKNMGDYVKALSSHEKALAIRQQSLPLTHRDLASTYNSIGIVYQSMGDYLKALPSHEKTLAIRQQSLPPTHPDLAMTRFNMGLVHGNMKNYWKAHSFYECTVDGAQQLLPPDHPDLQIYLNSLAQIKRKL